MKTLVCCFCIAVSSTLHVLASDQMAYSPDGKVLITRDSSSTSGWPTEHTMHDTGTGLKIKTWTDEG